MRIVFASVAITILRVWAGDKLEPESDRLSRVAIDLPPAGASFQRMTVRGQQRVEDGSTVQRNPFGDPDSQGPAVLKDPERQSKLETARFYLEIAPLVQNAVWFPIPAGLALLAGLWIKRCMMPSVEIGEGGGETAPAVGGNDDQAKDPAAVLPGWRGDGQAGHRVGNRHERGWVMEGLAFFSVLYGVAGGVWLGVLYVQLFMRLARRLFPEVMMSRDARLLARGITSGELERKIGGSTEGDDTIRWTVLNFGDRMKRTYTESKSNPSEKSELIVTPMD